MSTLKQLATEYKRLQKEYELSEGVNRILLHERLSGIQTGYELGTGKPVGSLLIMSERDFARAEWELEEKQEPIHSIGTVW